MYAVMYNDWPIGCAVLLQQVTLGGAHLGYVLVRIERRLKTGCYDVRTAHGDHVRYVNVEPARLFPHTWETTWDHKQVKLGTWVPREENLHA